MLVWFVGMLTLSVGVVGLGVVSLWVIEKRRTKKR